MKSTWVIRIKVGLDFFPEFCFDKIFKINLRGVEHSSDVEIYLRMNDEMKGCAG